MNGYLFYRRIFWPVMLLTFGITALLAEWDVISFGRSWPLYLIVYGLLRLAEGTARAVSPPPLPTYLPTPGYSPQGPGYGVGTYGAQGSPEYGSAGFQSVSPAAAAPSVEPAKPLGLQRAASTEEES